MSCFHTSTPLKKKKKKGGGGGGRERGRKVNGASDRGEEPGNGVLFVSVSRSICAA